MGIIRSLFSQRKCSKQYSTFYKLVLEIFKAEKLVMDLQAIESHGLWDKKYCFGDLPKQSNYEGTIAVLTRATIRLNKLSAFWKNVQPVAQQMNNVDGFITSFGIGEIPWIKQATFSIWQSKESMKKFAYSMQTHKDVIVKTKKKIGIAKKCLHVLL
jgi:hypothetical protein